MFILLNIFIIISFVKGDLIPIYEGNSTIVNDDFLIVSSFWIMGICSCIGLICCHLYGYNFKKRYKYNLHLNQEEIRIQ
tara:strand:- start:247 stop:483 length:237 start_codon:yes stop_codon:yes gene_type:complete